MKRVHVLSLLGVAVLAVVLFVVFSSPKDSGLLPGDSGMAGPGDSVAEANAEGGEGEAGKGEGENGEAADANRTAVAEAKPMATSGELEKASIKIRLVDSESQAATATHAQLTQGHTSMGMSAMSFIEDMRGMANGEEMPVVEADEEGNVVLTDVQPNQNLTLVVGGSYWAMRTMHLAALDPGEERDLGDLILAPGVLLSGRILGPDGKGVADATISLEDRNQKNDFGFAFGPTPGPSKGETTTDEDGNFTIEGVRTGEYSLEADANGFVRASTSLDLVQGRPDHRVDLHLATGASVSGVVRDQDGKPLPDARVVLVRARGFSTYQWNHKRILEKGTAVGEDGSFELSGLSTEGKWRVAAAAPGYARGRSENVSPGAKMDVQLDPRMQLAGRVTDAAGKAVAGASLAMQAQSADSDRDYFNRTTTETDEDGHYLFDELKEGSFKLDITSAAGVLEVDNVEVGPDNEPLNLVLPESHALTVAVTDEEGNPLADVSVSVEPQGGEEGYGQVMRISNASGVQLDSRGPGFGMRTRRAKTDENGLASFYGLAKGKWSIKGRLAHYAGQPVEVECNESAQEASLILYPASKVRLTAVDANGQIVAGARVVLSMESEADDFRQREATTDAWGLASWTGLAPGTYRISESADDSPEMVFFDLNGVRSEDNEEEATLENDVVFDLESGVIAEQQIVMAAKAVTTVLVTRLGTPATDVTVELEQPGDQNFGWGGMNEGSLRATTNAQGLATLPPCDAGEYVIKARATSASPATELKVNLAPGTQQVTVELASGVLTGTVVGTAGPVAGAQVRLTPHSEDGDSGIGGRMAISFASSDDDEPEIHTMDFRPDQTTARTDDKGQFRFQDVPAGNWDIEVSGKGYIPTTVDVGEFDGSGQRDMGIVQLETGGSLKGRVIGMPVNETSDGYSMNLLQLQQEGSFGDNMTMLRKSGEFHFKDLKPGVYTLTMHVDGEQRESDPIQINAGNPTEFTWSL
jgi:protocatechuate 3,4-dioxygenase beta subunit/phenylpyruvate tautomerase PptA (4-oxalocrotonate tautomerase family)